MNALARHAPNARRQIPVDINARLFTCLTPKVGNSLWMGLYRSVPLINSAIPPSVVGKADAITENHSACYYVPN